MIPKTWNFRKPEQSRTVDIQNPSFQPSSTAASIHQYDHQTLKPLIRVSTTIFDRITTDWWWWELASWLLSFTCVTAIFGMLLYYNGKQQPSHVLKGVTLNAFIAVFSGVAKAAMILPVSEAIGQLKWIWVQKERRLFDILAFDNASRGPWGSLMLLITSRCKELVSLGAGIMVLALAFEPFFQQSVSYPSHEIIVQDRSTVSVATSYRPVSDVSYRVATEYRWMGISYGAGIRSAALEIANVISARNESIRSAPSLCPTGRCTWSAYSSLAVCQRCQDVSHLLKPVCQKESLYFPDGASGAVNPCGYRLNDTIVTGVWGLWVNHTIGLSTMVVGTRIRTSSSPTYLNSTVFQGAPHALLNFYIGFVPSEDPGTFRNVTPILSECLFQWCVKTFDASFRDGRLEERVISTYLPPDTEAAAKPPAGELLNVAPNEPFIMMARGKAFEVGANTTSRLRNSLNANMPVYLMDQDLDATGQYPGRWNSAHNAPYNIKGVLDLMADAVTNHIRGSGNNGTEQIYGKSLGTETFVQIQWLWLLLPVFVLLSSLILISATIIRSRRNNVPSWKSSVLATLLHGLTEEAQDHLIPGATQSEVEALSRKLRIKMSLNRRLVPLESPTTTNIAIH